MVSPKPIINSVPPEVWLNILVHVDEPDLHSLKISSPHFRHLITANASTIANNLITSRYRVEAAIIGSTIKDGWIVPTHPQILIEEKFFGLGSRSTSPSGSLRSYGTSTSSRTTSPSNSMSSSRTTSPSRSINSSRSTRLSRFMKAQATSTRTNWSWGSKASETKTLETKSPKNSAAEIDMKVAMAMDLGRDMNMEEDMHMVRNKAMTIRTKLSEPGPQYLRFLAEYAFEIRVASTMFLEPAGIPKPNSVPATQSTTQATDVANTTDATNPSPAVGVKESIKPEEKDCKALSKALAVQQDARDRFDRWVGLYVERKFLQKLQAVNNGEDSMGGRVGRRSEHEAMMVKKTKEGLAWFYC